MLIFLQFSLSATAQDHWLKCRFRGGNGTVKFEPLSVVVCLFLSLQQLEVHFEL